MTESPTLRHQLEQAADDSHRPLTTDVGDLLDRARADRQRHRRTTLAAAVLTACALVGTTLGVRAALPDERGAEPGPAAPTRSAPPTTAPLTDAQVVRRCTPQLQKYAAFPMYAVGPPARMRLSHPERDYSPGDVVSVSDRRGTWNPMLCLLPEPGREDAPVAFEAFQPRPDEPALIAEVCSELMRPDPTVDPTTGLPAPGSGPTPDLRGAHVDAVSGAGQVVSALLSLGSDSWQCALSPLDWDSGVTGIDSAGRGLANVGINGSTTGSSNKSIVAEDASYYYAAGWLPRDAARLEVELGSAGLFSVTVKDGAYAFAHRETGPGGLLATRYRVFDKHGEVLYESAQQQ